MEYPASLFQALSREITVSSISKMRNFRVRSAFRGEKINAFIRKVQHVNQRDLLFTRSKSDINSDRLSRILPIRTERSRSVIALDLELLL